MDELSTPPIPEPVRAEDHRQPRAPAAPRPLEKRLGAQKRETETNEQDEPLENGEPKHHVDISV
jgi:hypothetical protein